MKRFEWDYETYQRWKVVNGEQIPISWYGLACFEILPISLQVKTRFEFPMELDVYPYTVEGASEADGRVSVQAAWLPRRICSLC